MIFLVSILGLLAMLLPLVLGSAWSAVSWILGLVAIAIAIVTVYRHRIPTRY